MVGIYEVLLGSTSIGQVDVEKLGLYYRFRCHCRLSGDMIYQLTVTCGGKQENLGVLTPLGSQFSLETKLPAKRFADGKPVFRVAPRHEPVSGRFVPIRSEEPFAYLSQLERAVYAVKDGQIGVIIPVDS